VRNAQTARRTIAVAVLGIAPLLAQPAPQFGLRFDSRSSMQWSRDTLMLLGNNATFVTVAVDSIFDLWPGPVRGAFAVLSNRGVSTLLGPTLGPSAHPFGARALLRSSRPQTVIACIDAANGAPHRRFVDWRSGDRQRELFVAPAEVLDFDVDVAGRILMLTVDQRVLAATGKAVTEIPLGAFGGPARGQRLLRIFVDDRGSEVAVLTADRLFRFSVENGIWSSVEFNAQTDALVRHVASRRMRVEPRFNVGARPGS
jgi:hypothetical protein